MYLATLVCPISTPSLRSSPCIRGAPHGGLAMLISRISLRISNGTVGLPPRAFDFQRQYKRKPALPFDYGLRLNNRQRIENARAKPIKANKNQSVDGAEGLFLRSGSPQNVYLLPQHPNFHLKRCPRPKQICDHPNNEPDKISHPARASPDSRSTASQIEFAIGTAAIYCAQIGIDIS